MKDILKGDIQALVPIYTKEGGNYTKILLKDKQVLLEKSIRTVLRDICKYYHYDLKISNRDYGSMINVKKTPPIPFTRDLILIAVKTRSPIGKDDGAFSYVNIERIKTLKDGTIYFNNGSSLKTLAKDTSIQKNISLARLLKSQANNRDLLVREEGHGPYDICMEDQISLREDLIVIYKRLKKIEGRLLK